MQNPNQRFLHYGVSISDVPPIQLKRRGPGELSVASGDCSHKGQTIPQVTKDKPTQVSRTTKSDGELPCSNTLLHLFIR
jgi:hypothetical protein